MVVGNSCTPPRPADADAMPTNVVTLGGNVRAVGGVNINTKRSLHLCPW